MTREEFLRQANAAAQASSKKSGLPAGVTVAQAALESAWGNSELSRRAHNYFGIKAHGKHAFVEMRTTEVISGVAREVLAKFSAYDSMAACFECRDRLITRAAVYAETRASAHDPEQFIRALAKHWATDPNYAEKILKIYREYDLSKLDAGDGAPSGVASGAPS